MQKPSYWPVLTVISTLDWIFCVQHWLCIGFLEWFRVLVLIHNVIMVWHCNNILYDFSNQNWPILGQTSIATQFLGTKGTETSTEKGKKPQHGNCYHAISSWLFTFPVDTPTTGSRVLFLHGLPVLYNRVPIDIMLPYYVILY